MEGSLSSNNGQDDPDFGMICFCGKPAPLKICGPGKNQGRRYFACMKFTPKREDCRFFCWYDYDPCMPQEMGCLMPMGVYTKSKSVGGIEQCESSLSMTESQELQKATMALQMKVDAIEKDVDGLKKKNGGKTNWIWVWVVFLSFVMWYYMYGP